MKPVGGVLVGFGVVVALLAFAKYREISVAIAANSGGPPPETVSTFIAGNELWREKLSAVASVYAVRGAELVAEDSGRVASIGVRSGGSAKRGDLIVELDSEIEQAALAGAEASVARTKRALTRLEGLFTSSAVSRDQVERAREEFERAVAERAGAKARLSRRRIVAPYDGQVGVVRVTPGQYVTTGVVVTSLVDASEVYLRFSLPQRSVGAAVQGAPVMVNVPGSDERRTARVVAVDPVIDEGTRTVLVEAHLVQEDGQLLPGMFVDASLETGEPRSLVTVPATAVQHAPYADTVYVVKPQREEVAGAGPVPRAVEQRVVSVQATRENEVGVTGGIVAGEEVVAAGAFKLRPDSLVMVNNAAEGTEPGSSKELPDS